MRGLLRRRASNVYLVEVRETGWYGQPLFRAVPSQEVDALSVGHCRRENGVAALAPRVYPGGLFFVVGQAGGRAGER